MKIERSMPNKCKPSTNKLMDAMWLMHQQYTMKGYPSIYVAFYPYSFFLCAVVWQQRLQRFCLFVCVCFAFICLHTALAIFRCYIV